MVSDPYAKIGVVVMTGGRRVRKAYKTYSTITDTKQVVLSGLPFREGEQVEILVLSTENGDRQKRIAKLRELFKETQAVPSVKTLTEGDILREIDAHRRDR